jgi:hypothetical protein
MIMDNKTVQYKRTFRGSVGAGVGSLLNGDGRRYYILQHKDASKYHKAGESQKIIVDEIELGRDSHCQVRFDESYPTVSRRHAAIVKDGNRWKLVQLSKTNSTFLNGHPVDTEWYLENGDEIQLSTDGPHLGFIVPEGKQSLVSSIKMTERLNLFRKQALRPYKTALISLCLALVLICCAGGYVIHNQSLSIEQLIAQSEVQADIIKKQVEVWKLERDSLTREIERLKKQPKKNTVIVRPEGDVLTKQLDNVKSSVYAVMTTVTITADGEKSVISQSQGTGFLLDDGRFVTARHCVEPWMFTVTGRLQQIYALSKTVYGLTVSSEILAVNKNGDRLTFKGNDFKINRTYDSPVNVPYKGDTVVLKGSCAYLSEASLGNDWAYCKASKKGNIKDGASFSNNLKGGNTVHVLGFPMSLGIADGSNIVDPIYNKMSISRDGLNNARCIMVSQGIDHGNSGGPVFVQKDGALYVIGIVSRGDGNSELYNHLVPMCNLN